MAIDVSKPAFPTFAEINGKEVVGSDGMTMREFWAANAPELPAPMMNALLQSIQEKSNGEGPEAQRLLAGCLAMWAFRYADAMLEQAKK